MVVRRGRPLKGFGGDSSSDSDDDAFAAMSKAKKKKQRLDTTTKDDNKNTSSTTTTTTETSSNKRHHHINASRQAKMESLLQELQTTKPSDQSSMRDDYYGTVENDEFYPGSSNRFAPDKKGSYVEPGMEHLTSNLFVGNLDPMTTEEELTDCFRQYGDLYSVKIMWPRTAEERARNRNTGFVCFMHRKDAEDAMDSLADADPLETGRRMNIGWGKNVKKTVKRGTGGVPLNFRKRPKENHEAKKPTSASQSAETGIPSKDGNHHQPLQSFPESTGQITNAHHPEVYSTSAASSNIHTSHEAVPKIKQQSQHPIYDPVQHSAKAIVVKAPSDARRMQFISTVASFVAKDGSTMEQKLIETQSFNSDFRFLTPYEEGTTSSGTSVDDNERFEEHVFYRWRVYAFAQGDGFNSWRTEPFVMFQPHGRYWIPPPLNTQAAQKEEESEKRREKHRLVAQEERRKLGADNKSQDCIKTGAQLRRSTDIVRLNEWEREVFHELLREKLCASQESICEAMAFCFDKSAAAREIAGLLKEALLENAISLETRIARLFLMSDILFNSQQPGVRNAFQYRSDIQAMSPEVFECLGKYECGRMTKNKLRKAVSSVLSAWTNWSVFDTDFIDELERKFEGREILVTGKVEGEQSLEDQKEETRPDSDNKEGLVPVDDKEASVSTTPRGTWTSATNDNVDADVDGEAIDEAIDGEAIDDLDGEEIDGEAFDEDIDGEEVDIDGLPDTETR